jgi:hypothetical protein
MSDDRELPTGDNGEPGPLPSQEEPSASDPAGTAPSPSTPDWGSPTPPPADPSDRWVRPDRPDAAPAGRRLPVFGTISQTVDIFLARPGAFLVLGTWGAVQAGVGVLFQGPSFTFTPSTAIGLALVSIVLAIVGIAFTLATIVIADGVRSGTPIGLGEALSLGLGRIPTVIASALVFVGAMIGFIVLAAITGVILVAIGSVLKVPALTAIVILIGVIGAFVAWGIAFVRWSLVQPAIMLAGAGPIESLRVSWRVTHRNALRLVATEIVAGLLIFPLSLGVGFLVLAIDNPLVTFAVSGLVGLVIGPVLPIALTVIFGELSGRPRVVPDPPPSPNRHRVVIGGSVLVGIAALAIGLPNAGAVLERAAFASIPVEDRGTIRAGTGRNPVDACRPTGVAATFSTSDSIYIGGYFTAAIAAGQSGSIDVAVNGTIVDTVPLTAGGQAVGCYYEPQPLVGARPGTYRLTVRYESKVIADGTFTVR